MGMLCVRHDRASAAVVRREIAADLAAHSVTADSVHDVVLVVSELVGNAVVHGAAAGTTDDTAAEDEADLDVAWDVDGETVIVRVKDGSRVEPTVRQVAPDAASGRGLAIVAALSTEWGTQRAARGKQVWARIPVHLAI